MSEGAGVGAKGRVVQFGSNKTKEELKRKDDRVNMLLE